MHPSPGNHPCLICATSQWCSRCQTTWYCSPEHLRGDWPRHREQCRPSPATLGYGAKMIATPPPEGPESISVSAILFVAEEADHVGHLPRHGISGLCCCVHVGALEARGLEILELRASKHSSIPMSAIGSALSFGLNSPTHYSSQRRCRGQTAPTDLVRREVMEHPMERKMS
ncbi:hypothetical protein B0H11DRAFT_1848460 [Mycena galericulata]|nr:hypothetical protein B0H11DRAFT_1848460 [Mycena galericulata]